MASRQSPRRPRRTEAHARHLHPDAPLKYEKYAEKGKPEKLEKAMEKQRAKLQKATDKGKPQEYLMYKAEKIEFTQKMWTLAHLVANMKRAGFLPQVVGVREGGGGWAGRAKAYVFWRAAQLGGVGQALYSRHGRCNF